MAFKDNYKAPEPGDTIMVAWSEGGAELATFVKWSGTGYRVVKLEANGVQMALDPNDKIMVAVRP